MGDDHGVDVPGTNINIGVNTAIGAVASTLTGGMVGGPGAGLTPFSGVTGGIKDAMSYGTDATRGVGGAISGTLSNSYQSAVTGGILNGVTGGSYGSTQAAMTAMMPKPPTPGDVNIAAAPSQAQDAAPNVGGYNMDLAQRAAMTAGGTLFSTPKQWWGQQYVDNDRNVPRRTLLGA